MLLVMITAAPAERNNMTYKIHHVINNSPSLILGASKVALDVDGTLLIEENTKYKQVKKKVYLPVYCTNSSTS